MKKRKIGKKLSRGMGSRKALSRSLVRSLVLYGSIKTTKAKAKFIRANVEKMVNLAKDNTVSARRRLLSILGNDKKTVSKLIVDISPLFLDRKGGYTKCVNLPRRKGDYAEIVRFEWTKQVEIKEKIKRGKEPVDSKKEKNPLKKLGKSITKKTTKSSKNNI